MQTIELAVLGGIILYTATLVLLIIAIPLPMKHKRGVALKSKTKK